MKLFKETVLKKTSGELYNVSEMSFIKVYIKMRSKILFITSLFNMHRPATRK